MTTSLPTTATLSASTAATVTVYGAFPRLHVLPLTASMVVYCRGDGGTAVEKADLNYVAPPLYEPTCVPTKSTGVGGTTSLSLISATAGDVNVSFCNCDD